MHIQIKHIIKGMPNGNCIFEIVKCVFVVKVANVYALVRALY